MPVVGNYGKGCPRHSKIKGVRPSSAKIADCIESAVCVGDTHNEIHDFESGQIFSNETETVRVGNTAVVSQLVSPGRSSGRIRGEPDVNYSVRWGSG